MAQEEKNRREQAREALLTVARAPAKASHTAEVWSLLPEIEKALDAGATRAEVFDSLCEAGAWTATFSAFKAALQRARKRARKAASKSAASSPTGGAGTTVPKAFQNWREIDLGLGEKRVPPKEEPLKLNVLKGKKPKQ